MTLLVLFDRNDVCPQARERAAEPLPASAHEVPALAVTDLEVEHRPTGWAPVAASALGVAGARCTVRLFVDEQGEP